MSLLTPWFLAGLGLLSLPIIIHLTQRQRSRVTAFPSIMFLRRVPFKTKNRRRIRHPLLFALRCLAIILLALAFARPFVDSAEEAAGEAARDVVLLIDESASLAYGDRWEAALDSARALLSELGEGDRVAVASFDERARERLPLSLDVAAARSALAGLSPTDRRTRIEAGLQLAGRILADSDRRTREVVLISDFQRTGWDDGRVRLPDGVSLRAASVASGPAANVAVAEATVRAAGGGRARVVVRLANMGEEAVGALPVSLEIAGRPVATLPVELPARAGGTVVFEDIALPEGRSRGRLTVPGDGLAIDDAFRFVTAPEAGLRTLILEAASGGRPEERSLFLARALEIGDTPPIAAARLSAARIDGSSGADALARADFVVLNDGSLAEAGRADRLSGWVRAGGGLLLVLGPRTQMERWSETGRSLLGATPGGLVESAGGRRLSWLDYDHPVFELFSAPRSGDFSSARFHRLWHLEPTPGARVLARFDGGEPALLEHTLGEGRVLVWTSTLDRFWNDLALQPVFLPFVHRLALHASGYREPERWIETGTTLELASLAELAGAGGAGTSGGPTGAAVAGRGRPADGMGGEAAQASEAGEADFETRGSADGRGGEAAGGAGGDGGDDRAGDGLEDGISDSAVEWVLIDPAGDRRPVEVAEGRTWLEFPRAGFYRIEATGDQDVYATVAVNTSIAESDLAPVATEQVMEGAAGAPAGSAEGGAAAEAGAEEVPRRAELWWILLLAAALVLGAESVLANRWAQRRPASALS